jgi:hypothetical protein
MSTPCRGLWYDPPCIEHARCKAALRVPGLELTWCGKPLTAAAMLVAFERGILDSPCQCGDRPPWVFPICALLVGPVWWDAERHEVRPGYDG